MASTATSPRRHVISHDAALAGILALLIGARTENDKDLQKIEILLSRAGLSNNDIAAVTDKRPDAIRMAITRAKPKRRAE